MDIQVGDISTAGIDVGETANNEGMEDANNEGMEDANLNKVQSVVINEEKLFDYAYDLRDKLNRFIMLFHVANQLREKLKSLE